MNIMKIKLSIKFLLSISLTILFFISNIHTLEGQGSNLPKNFVDMTNPKLGVGLKYPKDWRVEYSTGNNKSLVASPAMFNEFIKGIKEDKNLSRAYPTDSDKRQYFQNTINNCGILGDCRLIGDTYLRSYLRDRPWSEYLSIFDYVPSLAFFPPLENSTDNFFESVKIASFTLPDNSSLADFVSLYDNYNLDFGIASHYNCQFNLLGYPGCVLIYAHNIESDIEKIHYRTVQLFMEKDDKVYLISYNALAETYLKYFDMVKVMLESIKLI
jgi:hypothetical protein